MHKKNFRSVTVVGHGVKYNKDSTISGVGTSVINYPMFIGQLIVALDDEHKNLKTIPLYNPVTRKGDTSFVVEYRNTEPDPNGGLELFTKVVTTYPICTEVMIVAEETHAGRTFYRMPDSNEVRMKNKPENVTIGEVVESKKRKKEEHAKA